MPCAIWRKCCGCARKSISAAEFFHGTLEVIDRDSNLLIFMGEDDARKQTDRVYAFAQRICANISVFDTKDYAMEGIEEKSADF